IQAHSASMGMIIYDGDQFPSEYGGGVFLGEHGPLKRPQRTRDKRIRVRVKEGGARGGDEGFLSGVLCHGSCVWARARRVAVAHDGPLLVSEDANGTMWRVSYRGGP